MGCILGLTVLRFPQVTTQADDRVPKFMDNGRLRIHKLFLLDHGINASSCRRNFAQLVRAGNAKLDRLRNRPGRDLRDMFWTSCKFAGNRTASPTLIPATKTPNATIQQPCRSEDFTKNLAAAFRYLKVGELRQDWQNE